MLRAELGQSLLRSTGLNNLELQKYALRNTYEWLYDSFDWRFLKIYREENLLPGQRFYNFDTDLTYENVDKVWVKHSDQWLPVHFGIKPEHYAQSREDERRDPVSRWDSHESNEFEVWPAPASAGKLKMFGTKAFKPLTDEKDVCLLDGLLVVQFTAARAAKGKASNAQIMLDAANSRLRHLRAKTRAKKSQPFVMGGGSVSGPALRPGIDYIPERS